MSAEGVNGSAPKDESCHKEQWLCKTAGMEKQESLKNVLQQNMMKAVNLTATKDGYLHFGDVVMLVNAGGEERASSAVSINANISGLAMSPSPGIKSPCEVSAGKESQPCTRNTFIITSVDGSPERSTLLFGQSLALKTTNGFARGFYLSSNQRPSQKLLMICAQRPGMQEVNLVDQVSFQCWWKILHFDPEERLEYEGQPVTASKKVVLKHYKTNQALVVLGDHVLETAYGENYELAVHTFLDADKADRNHWILHTYQPAIEDKLLKQPESSAGNVEPEQKNAH